MNKSLLPHNATSQERAIESVIQRAHDIPVPIASVWHPQTCPAPLLPWLAWALSVDNWDSQWSDQTKRSVIANSVVVHRHKGTLSAIERVLAALGVTAELVEWFENNRPPHTFQLTAWANTNISTEPNLEPILNASLYRSIKTAIDHVKPVRSHYDFLIGARFGNEIGMTCLTRTASAMRVHSIPIVDSTLAITGFRLTPQLQPVMYLRLTLEIL